MSYLSVEDSWLRNNWIVNYNKIQWLDVLDNTGTGLIVYNLWFGIVERRTSTCNLHSFELQYWNDQFGCCVKKMFSIFKNAIPSNHWTNEECTIFTVINHDSGTVVKQTDGGPIAVLNNKLFSIDLTRQPIVAIVRDILNDIRRDVTSCTIRPVMIYPLNHLVSSVYGILYYTSYIGSHLHYHHCWAFLKLNNPFILTWHKNQD